MDRDILTKRAIGTAYGGLFTRLRQRKSEQARVERMKKQAERREAVRLLREEERQRAEVALLLEKQARHDRERREQLEHYARQRALREARDRRPYWANTEADHWLDLARCDEDDYRT